VNKRVNVWKRRRKFDVHRHHTQTQTRHVVNLKSSLKLSWVRNGRGKENWPLSTESPTVPMTFWAPFVNFFIMLIFPGGGPQSRVSESLKHKQRKQKGKALKNSDHETLLHQHKEFITNTITVNLYISSQMRWGEKNDWCKKYYDLQDTLHIIGLKKFKYQ
jgi:hypothetical protein